MDNIRALINNELSRVDAILSRIFNENDNNEVYAALSDFLNSGSKRIRSIICILYLKSYGVNISQNVIYLLVAIELIHNASLLQDDVIDDADMRRGKTVLQNTYNSKIAILLSDLLLSKSVYYLMQLPDSQIMSDLLIVAEDMGRAEIKQYLSRGKHISINDYIEVVSGKTASLFESMLKSAAILTELDIIKAQEFGKKFGILFQINNDLQEVSKLNDRHNQVMTIEDILGIEKTQIFKDNYKREINDLLSDSLSCEYKKGLEGIINKL